MEETRETRNAKHETYVTHENIQINEKYITRMGLRINHLLLARADRFI